MTGFESRGFRALGYRSRCAVEGDDVLGPYVSSLFEAFPTDERPSSSGTWARRADAPGNWALVVDGAAQATAERPEQLVSPCVHHLNRLAIASWDGVVCHAGGVVRDGVGVLLPAHMESGKSTLTAGLVRAGAEYLSDEAVAFERDTAVMHPYAKPLSIDPGAWYLFPELEPEAPFATDGYKDAQWQVPPARIRPDRGGRPVRGPPAWCSRSTSRDPTPRSRRCGAPRRWWSWRRTRSRSTARVATRSTSSPGVVRAVDCYRMTVGDLDHAVALVGELVAGVDGERAA